MPPGALLDAAAAGQLPDWARAGESRRAHMQRVADLLGGWADTLNLSRAERTRWRAAGFLHDALRDAPPDDLRRIVPEPLRDLPDKLLHGPAAATRLRADGIDDEPFLRAIAFHTIGHPDLDELGRALYIADYIEPGRNYNPVQLAMLRARMPAARDDVLRDVLRARVQHQIEEDRPMRSETAEFWSVINRDNTSVPVDHVTP